MIHEVTGDILLTKAQAIAHGVLPMIISTRGWRSPCVRNGP